MLVNPSLGCFEPMSPEAVTSEVTVSDVVVSVALVSETVVSTAVVSEPAGSLGVSWAVASCEFDSPGMPPKSPPGPPPGPPSFPPPMLPMALRLIEEASIRASLLLCSDSVDGIVPSNCP